jgi:glyoxylase-like metal-dependent hydrolase (beta-lactamase superfamily II)
VERVTDDLHMIKGLGGNVAVLKTGAGAVIVDTMTFTMQGTRIRHLAESLTGEQVVMVINTHYHGDHTHGNPGFLPGTQVLSTTRTLEHLNTLDAAYWTGDAAVLLPNHTFEKDLDAATAAPRTGPHRRRSGGGIRRGRYVARRRPVRKSRLSEHRPQGRRHRTRMA